MFHKIPGKSIIQLNIIIPWHDRIFGSVGFHRLEKIGAARSHLMKISDDIWIPLMIPFEFTPALGVDTQKPIPVEVKPIVISPAARPTFVVLGVNRIIHRGVSFIHIGPVSMPVPA